MTVAKAAMSAIALEENAALPGVQAQLPGPPATSTPAQLARLGGRPVQLNLSEEAYEKLSHLKEVLGAASRTEVIRLGLGVLGWLVEELSQNHKILATRDEGQAVELAFPYLAIRTKSHVTR